MGVGARVAFLIRRYYSSQTAGEFMGSAQPLNLEKHTPFTIENV
jgi:hypothetical protein